MKDNPEDTWFVILGIGLFTSVVISCLIHIAVYDPKPSLLINNCEAELPRNQSCVLNAIPRKELPYE